MAANATMEELDRLRRELGEVTKERDQFRKTILAMLPNDTSDYDEEKLYQEMGKYPSMHDLIREYEGKAASDAP